MSKTGSQNETNTFFPPATASLSPGNDCDVSEKPPAKSRLVDSVSVGGGRTTTSCEESNHEADYKDADVLETLAFDPATTSTEATDMPSSPKPEAGTLTSISIWAKLSCRSKTRPSCNKHETLSLVARTPTTYMMYDATRDDFCTFQHSGRHFANFLVNCSRQAGWLASAVQAVVQIDDVVPQSRVVRQARAVESRSS